MMEATVLFGVHEGVARVTLNRPETRNALSFEMVEALDQWIDAAVSDPAVRVVRLDASGVAFCAGIDLKSVDLSDPDQAGRFSGTLSDVYRKLLTLPIPLLCSVDGPATGGGVGLAAAADLVWAGPRAMFALPETRLGLVPAIVSVVLRRRLSPQRISGMALGGISLDATRALASGMADFRTEGMAAEDADEFAHRLVSEHSPRAMGRTKTFLVTGISRDLEREFEDAQREFEAAVATEDARRGIAAFRRKESVVWDAE